MRQQVVDDVTPLDDYLSYAVAAAAVGSGLMAGLFFVFSNVAMRAFGDLGPERGMEAMQRINVRILNPVFFLVFFGTSILCVVVGIVCVGTLDEPGRAWFLAGGTAYVLGVFAVTVAFNVPLNNKLARATPSDALVAWPAYVSAWLPWNHVRTWACLVALTCFMVGFARGG